MKSSTLPDGMPILSRGRHRTPRRGACFMELASLLAGEPWSDHPSCTHPLLGQLARQVNDETSDAGRQELARLIPSVVGRRGDDTTSAKVSVAVAARVILDVPETAQRVLAGGLIRAEQLCADKGGELAATGRQARAAIDLAPDAAAWFERLSLRDRISEKAYAGRCAPMMIHCAIEGIVASADADRDQRLRELLELGIAACPWPPAVVSTSPTGRATADR
jgi:hypothetical protein